MVRYNYDLGKYMSMSATVCRVVLSSLGVIMIAIVFIWKLIITTKRIDKG